MSGAPPIAARSCILSITPYEGGESEIEGKSEVIKLASNEGALGPSADAVAAFEAASLGLPRYPDGTCAGLRAAIGKRFGLDPARIVCGAGSDELLGLLARAYANEGDEVLYSEHGFLIYPIAAMAAGAVPVKVPETGLKADPAAFAARAGNRVRLAYLANPNNPTGSYLSRDELFALRRGLPEGVLLVIDAAYAEFVTEQDYDAGVALVDAFDNVVMTRTFSKVFGLAALRIGWAYGPDHVIDALNRLRMPFNVSAPAQAAAIAALSDDAHTKAARAHNQRLRARLSEALRGMGIEVPPSAANFVLARFAGGPREAEAADRFLRERGIIVRRMAGYGLPDSLRVTVGLEAEVEAFIAAMAEFADGKGRGNA